MYASFKVARSVLVAIGVVFLVSGTMVTTLNRVGVLPSSYNWQGPLFLLLGAIGANTAWFGLRSPRVWPLAVLVAVYVPWIIVGLVGDIGQGFWPLVAAEALGLVLFFWAATSAAVASNRRSRQAHTGKG